MGQGGSMILAEEAAHIFSTVSEKFWFMQDSHKQASTIALTGEKDVLLFFSYSGSTKELMELTQIARERGAKIIEKENKKMEAKYAAGKQSFTERVMSQNTGAARVQETEKTKNMSNRELSAYNKQKIQDARKRMAEKYGESYDENPPED